MARPPTGWILALAVPLRLALDLSWWVQTPVGSLGRLGSGILSLILVAIVASRWRRAAAHPLAPVLWLLIGVIGVGVLRAGQPRLAVAYGLHLLIPVAWLLALWVAPPPRGTLALWVASAGLPVGISVLALLVGQPAAHVLHGWPRLLGGYGNVHTHAGVMALVSVTAWGLARRHRWAGIVALGATICLGATFVRTAWLWAACAALGAACAARRWRWAALASGLGAVAAVASGRLGDVLSVLTLTPPPGGWGAIGSSRGRIWADSLARFLDEGAWVLIWGRGLGGHLGLHRHLDPHSDLLSLWFQLGLVGVGIYGLWLGWAATLLWRRARDGAGPAALAFGLLVGSALTAPLSNDWLTRASAVLWVWGVVGLALVERSPGEGLAPASPRGRTRAAAGGARGPGACATPPPPPG